MGIPLRKRIFAGRGQPTTGSERRRVPAAERSRPEKMGVGGFLEAVQKMEESGAYRTDMRNKRLTPAEIQSLQTLMVQRFGHSFMTREIEAVRQSDTQVRFTATVDLRGRAVRITFMQRPNRLWVETGRLERV